LIIDAHHHFWAPARGDYGWMPAGHPVLTRDYLPSDIRPLLRKTGVDRTVLVQAAPTEAETAYLLQLADSTDFVAGVVGWLDFEDAHFPSKLDRLVAHPKLVGLRPMLQDLEDDAYIMRPLVLANLRHLAASHLSLDVLTFPRQLPHVIHALEAVPNLRAVINHVSKPPIATGWDADWARDIAQIAAGSGVYCKLSGMVTEADHANWRPNDLAPFINHVFDCFGADRLMFGSDWPVCLLAAEYGEVLNALRTIIDARLDATGIAKIYGSNALDFYRLDNVK
jgi:L-fuconolactonase